MGQRVTIAAHHRICLSTLYLFEPVWASNHYWCNTFVLKSVFFFFLNDNHKALVGLISHDVTLSPWCIDSRPAKNWCCFLLIDKTDVTWLCCTFLFPFCTISSFPLLPLASSLLLVLLHLPSLSSSLPVSPSGGLSVHPEPICSVCWLVKQQSKVRLTPRHWETSHWSASSKHTPKVHTHICTHTHSRNQITHSLQEKPPQVVACDRCRLICLCWQICEFEWVDYFTCEMQQPDNTLI